MPTHCAALQPSAAAAVQIRCQQHAAPPPSHSQHGQRQPSAAAFQPQRRHVLGGLLGSLATLRPAASWADAAADGAGQGAAPKPGSLAARIATQGNVQQPGIQPPWAPKQLFYPRFMFGEWQVRPSEGRPVAVILLLTRGGGRRSNQLGRFHSGSPALHGNSVVVLLPCTTWHGNSLAPELLYTPAAWH